MACGFCVKVRTHLKIPPLFKNGDDGFVDVSDELVSLRFPQVVDAQLQLLNQRVLQTRKRARLCQKKEQTELLGVDDL